MIAVGETLLDLETSYFTVETELSRLLSHTTARTQPIDRAEYIFYPNVTENDLEILATANLGSMLYPDQAATLILGGTLGNGTTLQLSGPGIQGSNTVQVGNIPAGFWTLRQKVQRYPLGWDIFVLDGDRVIGLPRSTRIDSER